MRTKTKFIVVEGGDGSGKSTLIEHARKVLGEDIFVFTREPGGSDFGEVIRNVALKNPLASLATPETQFALMWAARHDNLHKKVLPALSSGKSVISDRFDISTFAYQVFGSDSDTFESLFWSTRDHFLGNNKPDLYIILDLDPHVGLARVSKRANQDGNAGGDSKNHFDERGLPFHEKVRKGLLDFSRKIPNACIIDASMGEEEVKEAFLKEIRRCLES